MADTSEPSDPNGPAFPVTSVTRHISDPGMSRRDLATFAAMHALTLADPQRDPASIARAAQAIASAVIGADGQS
jgi:hypothetical protein